MGEAADWEAAFDKELADEIELAGGDHGSFDDELRLLHLFRLFIRAEFRCEEKNGCYLLVDGWMREKREWMRERS